MEENTNILLQDPSAIFTNIEDEFDVEKAKIALKPVLDVVERNDITYVKKLRLMQKIKNTL